MLAVLPHSLRTSPYPYRNLASLTSDRYGCVCSGSANAGVQPHTCDTLLSAAELLGSRGVHAPHVGELLLRQEGRRRSGGKSRFVSRCERVHPLLLFCVYGR